MSQFYNRMQGVASKLMNQFAQGSVSYIPIMPGVNKWDGAQKGAPIPMDATVSGMQQEYVDSLVSMSDLIVTSAAFVEEPKNGGIISVDGKERQVLKVQALPAAGPVVAWRIFVKG